MSAGNEPVRASAARIVRVSTIVDALSAAGLLVSESDALPESVTDVIDDSRRVTAGSMFIAVRGHAQDGHDWLQAAATSGASCAIVEDASRSTVPSIVVRDGRRAAAVAAAAFHGFPAHALSMIGVTGTNGKTTTVGLLRHLLDSEGAPSASIGTLGVLIGSEGRELPGGGGLTTPGPVELQRVLRELVERGVRTVTMEVSSHSLDQRRVEGLEFVAAVFTNLTRDHLDYHLTFEAYFAAKAKLVSLLTSNGTAVANADDHAWQQLPAAPHSLSFGRLTPADVSARDIVFEANGSRFTLVTPAGNAHVTLPLIGDFNVDNALAAAGAGIAIGMTVEQIAHKLSNAPQVPGRLEVLRRNPTVLRDYAHTPDALDRAIRAVRPFARTESGATQLIALFGCGGDRDKGKRPIMGEIGETLADRVIITSDNPRTEDPEAILDDIEAGMKQRKHERIADRRAAIARAIQIASPDDVVLLAGKGHETYQIRGKTSYPFDEREIVAELSAES